MREPLQRGDRVFDDFVARGTTHVRDEASPTGIAVRMSPVWMANHTIL